MERICHVTSVHKPEDGRIFHKECTSLAKAGYETYLVAPGDKSYEKNGVHIIGVGSPSGGRLARMTTFAKRVYQQALALDAELYHLHDPELLPWGMKLKRRGKKVIFDSHEMYREQLRRKPYLPLWCTMLIAACYSVYEDYVLKRVDALIFPALMQGEDPFRGKYKRLCIINNVPRLEELYDRFDPDAAKSPKSVCYVGALTYDRGITHLIKAIERAGGTLYLAGTFCPQEYQQEVEVLSEYAAVHYCGVLDRTGILELLQRCEIGAATLLNMGQYDQFDNLATKAYEYMSVGLPVLLSRTHYNEQMIEKYHFGICVDPENVDEIAAAIQYLLEHSEEARQMGENGRRAIKEEFNWGVEGKKLLALYAEILNSADK